MSAAVGEADTRRCMQTSTRLSPESRLGITDLRSQLRLLALLSLGITLVLGPWLWGFIRFCLSNDLYSHVVLMPVVTAYLVWQLNLNSVETGRPVRIWMALPLALALLGMGFWLWGNLGPMEDRMAAFALMYVGLIWTALLGSVGTALLKWVAFPFALLVFMIPFPVAVENGIEYLLQHGSAECAYWMFKLSGMTLFRDNLIFHLPGISMEVAPQCSGIRSTLVLFITSLVGGYLFLRRPRNRIILALAVIPLALLRNGFRVFVLGELCVRVDRNMINSWVHHQGGPIFFALSLIPFSLIVWLLMRSEKRA